MPWVRAEIRGASVLARCDDGGELRVEKGRVEIRYNASSEKAYRAGVGNLSVSEGGEVLPDSHCAEAKEPAPKAKKKAKSKSKKATGAPPPTEPVGDEVVAYCDGACSGNPGPSGLGAVLIWDGGRRELSEYLGHGTNNTAELTAIMRVAQGTPDASRPLRIYTDSSYSIGVLTKGWKAKANKELIAEAKSALRGVEDVELFYVKGHAGIELNERADELARESVEERASSGWLDA